MSVILLNMPFANLRWPNLGLSLLKSSLKTQGIDCDLVNFQFDLAEMVGTEIYQWIADHFAFVLGGERFFANEYFGDTIPDDEAFWQKILLKAEPSLDQADKDDFFSVSRVISDFLNKCVNSVDWAKYQVVGFTTSYQQTFASLCLARLIKEKYPEIVVIFGGAACEGVMGEELAASFPEINHIFTGEADITFPGLINSILNPGPSGSKSPKFPRVVHGDKVMDLDMLAAPDFGDFFERFRESPATAGMQPLLFFETSRGCWWGQKMQCLFCGLNGNSLHYRSKSPQVAADELEFLAKRYGAKYGCAADNIFDTAYFEEFLPLLREKRLDFRFEYEMKANLNKSQVERFVAAGLGAAQLGLETFSSPILKLLNKGATARHNLQVLKWFTEAGIEVKWNFLYGFPGEDREEYPKLCELIPKIAHFAPPLAHGYVRVDRFAPYHAAPEKYGIVNLRPFAGFRYIYPFEDERLRRLAYYHDFDFADGREISEYIPPLVTKIEKWQETYFMQSLRYFDRGDVLILSDTRGIAREFQHRLHGVDREVYLFCDAGRTWEEIAAKYPIEEKRLQNWIEAGIMLLIDGRYFFSIALRSPGD